MKCWIAGIGKAGGKQLYNRHWVMFPTNHPLRAPSLCILHNRTGRTRSRNENCDWRRRSHSEIMARLKVPDETAGPMGEGFPGFSQDIMPAKEAITTATAEA
ncbi:hypothetical protein CEUSTIGMA_g7208.t1 [Chlamydomonas eustigma]|uniref:Uncharacterized protein n=1 Tax=Chlamydomonas eustigma TaxID=1157962 RepID=A0A250X9L9_9CHLO|nr:hypothetical protein CEUSTIGMA_g7208.t1 [Chlamydomonas eustigma]|eukprot:GAX79768.1 hypothetical protein CEUSTIGMA_g7208.t1 [Chlamydomonas eustigma]